MALAVLNAALTHLPARNQFDHFQWLKVRNVADMAI